MADLANATLQAAAAQNVNPCSVVIYWTPTNPARQSVKSTRRRSVRAIDEVAVVNRRASNLEVDAGDRLYRVGQSRDAPSSVCLAHRTTTPKRSRAPQTQDRCGLRRFGSTVNLWARSPTGKIVLDTQVVHVECHCART